MLHDWEYRTNGTRFTRQALDAGSAGTSKRRGHAIALAILFGPFTWLYTYAADAKRFWAAMAISALNIVGVIATAGAWLPFAQLVATGIAVWAILDAFSKDASWYEDYHNTAYV